jgi:hypothetical protein
MLLFILPAVPCQLGFYKMMLLLAAMAVEAFERLLLNITALATTVHEQLGFYKMMLI